MKNILKKFKNMKYRHKLTILLVVVSLVPVTVISLYGHMRMSSLVRENEMEEMNSILEQTRESIDSQVQVYTIILRILLILKRSSRKKIWIIIWRMRGIQR